jgi:hypothetical protein
MSYLFRAQLLAEIPSPPGSPTTPAKKWHKVAVFEVCFEHLYTSGRGKHESSGASTNILANGTVVFCRVRCADLPAAWLVTVRTADPTA